MNLFEIKEKTTVQITAMDLENREVMKLSQLGLRVGSQIVVERFAPLGGPVLVMVELREIALGKKLASRIQVEKI